jgi:FAD-dependent urate hydroxylase
MKALIIGGGIAGAANALGLHKAGIDCELYEARDRHSDGTGAFLTLAVNGISTLRMLGLDVAAVPGIDTPRMQIALGDGQQLAAFPLGPILADGTVTRTVKRSDLYTALRERVAELGIPISYGKKLVDATTARSMVTARFEDATTASGDLLIGADGLHSRVRSIIDPKAPSPRYLGILNAGGYAHGIDAPEAHETMQMIFGKKTFFSYLEDDADNIWWFANPPMAKEPRRGELSAIPEETWRSTLRALVDDDAGRATAIIDASSELFAPWPTHDFPTVPTWHRNNMIIVGDAAHAASPSSGQGASMAIEDAAVLALALRDSADIPTALATYETLRRPRTSRVVAQGKRNGTGNTPGPFGRTIRDFFLKRIFAKPPKNERQGWLYEYPIDWDAGIGSVRR